MRFDKPLPVLPFQNDLSAVTRTLSRNHDLRVVFTGSGASTVIGSMIMLPAIDLDTPIEPDHARIIRGYADHEAGHNRHTASTATYRRYMADPVKGRLLNAVEDMRLEQCMIELYPGVAENIAATFNHTLEETLANSAIDWSDDAAMLAIGITWVGRKTYLDNAKIPLVDKALDRLSPALRSFLDEIAGQMGKTLMFNCQHGDEYDGKPNTITSIKVVDWICRRLSAMARQGPARETTRGSNTTGEDRGTDKARSCKEPKRGQSNKASQPLTLNDIPATKDPVDAGLQIGSALQHYRPTTSGDYVPYTTAFDIVVDAKGSRRLDGSTTPVALSIGADPDRYHRIKQQSGTVIKTLTRHLDRDLQSLRRTRHEGGKTHGRLDSRRLVAATRGASEVYRQKIDSDELDTAVTVMVDHSASMRSVVDATRTRMQIAAETCVALTEAVVSIGLPLEILGWNTWRCREQHCWPHEQELLRKLHTEAMDYSRGSPVRYFVYKPFNGQLRDCRPALGAMAGNAGNINVDGEAIAWAATRLLMRRERRKLLIVISDGQPCNAGAAFLPDTGVALMTGQDHLHSVIANIEKTGRLDLFAIGIANPQIGHYYPHSANLDDASELPKAVFGKLARVLFPSRDRRHAA